MRTVNRVRTPFRFHPPWWATLATLAACSVFAMAGVWQLDRAAERRTLLALYEAGAGDAAPLPAPAGAADLTGLRYRHIVAEGSYDAAHQVLLDARTRAGRTGYEVLTPLVGPDRAVLVNRGWIPADPDRSRLPPVDVGAGPRRVEGLLDRLPRSALAEVPQEAGGWPRRMLYPTADQIAAALGYPVTDYQLLLAPGEPDGFLREWRPALMEPSRHIGYAVQWLALAAAAVVLYVALNLRRAR
jgi:surfeit locus 1 family protein